MGERELWERARPGLAQQPDMDEAELLTLLAARLDGDLPEAEAEALEARLATEPALLETFLAAREALPEAAAAHPEAAPESLVARARGLAPAVCRAAPVKVAARPRGFLAGLFDDLGLGGNRLRPLRLAQSAGLAAALLVACVAGFELGQSGYAEYREQQAALETPADFGLGGPDLF